MIFLVTFKLHGQFRNLVVPYGSAFFTETGMSNINVLNITVWFTALLIIHSNSWPLPYGILRYFSPGLLLFLYRLCYVVIYEVVLLYYFTSVYSSFLLYLVWVFCLIPLALCCSLKLFLLAQRKYVPLSSIHLDVAAKLENKRNKKKRERERENEKWNKLRTLLYSCNITFCWRNSYPSGSFLIFTPPENKSLCM